MNSNQIDMSQYKNMLGRKHQIIRLLWGIVWTLFARPLPRSMGNSWKIFLLRTFGAKIGKGAVVYSSAKIYYPANLIMESYSCIGAEVDCYNVDLVKIGANATISQGAYLCTASHNIYDKSHALINAPIVIEDQVWVGAKAYVGLGVTIGQGAVVGATASVYKNVAPWTVVGGNPAIFLKNREINS